MNGDVLTAVDEAHLGHFIHGTAEACVISGDPFGGMGEGFVCLVIGGF